MNERFESTRYALDDDALDGLLSGDIDPSLTDMDTNPVASFFAEVRSTSFADTPRPDPRLSEVFATAPTAGNPAIGAKPASGPGPSEPTAVNWAGAVEFDETPAPTRVRKNPGFVPAAPVGVYRPSAFEATMNALRPTPSKVLVGVSVLLVVFISAQILWFSGSPDDELQEVAGVETSSVTTLPTADAADAAPTITVAPLVETTDTMPTTPVSAAPVQPAPAPAPTAATTTPTRPQLGPTAPTVPTSPTTTPTVPTSAVTVVPSSETTIDPSSTSTPTPTETAPVTNETTPVTEPPPSTDTTIPTVTISPGRVSTVPGNIPAGVYRAVVQSPTGCDVRVVNADGNQSSYQAAAGTQIVFQLLDGSRVLTAAGCPSTFQVT